MPYYPEPSLYTSSEYLSVRARLSWPILQIGHDNYLSCPSYFAVILCNTLVYNWIKLKHWIGNSFALQSERMFWRWRLFHIRYKWAISLSDLLVKKFYSSVLLLLQFLWNFFRQWRNFLLCGPWRRYFYNLFEVEARIWAAVASTWFLFFSHCLLEEELLP